MNETNLTKNVVSVSEMARTVGLSRSRFYQLIGSAFPHPSRDPQTGRPFYDEDQQQTCLEVRRRNCGIDGRQVLFYARRSSPSLTLRRPRKSKAKTEKPASQFAAVLEGVRALGLASATERQIEQAVRELFPAGTTDAEPGEVIRAVFVHLMRQNPADSVGR